ncbi:MAG: O-antigen ligase family protein, partial [Planctomycetota bacterium]
GHKLMNSNVLGFAGTVVFLWSISTLRSGALYGSGESVQAEGRGRALIGRYAVALVTLAVSAYVLYYARSRTASIAALGGFAILFFPWQTPRLVGRDGLYGLAAAQRRRRLALIAAGCVALLAVATSVGAIEAWFLRGGSASDVATGTGRTGLWQDLLLLQVPTAPLLGAGYLNLSSAGGFEHAGHAWNNAHNTYLFALVSTGIPGLLCVLAIIGWPLWSSLQRVLRAPLCATPEELHRGFLDQEAWTLVFAFESIIAVASITGFGVAGYPNVAMLFHYGLYAWATSPIHGARRLSLPVSAPPATIAFAPDSARLFACQNAHVPHSVR